MTQLSHTFFQANPLLVLFSSGVGYFEHFGTVHGAAATELRFKTNQIDGIVTETSTVFRLEEEGSGRILVRFGERIKDFHVHVIYASKALIDKNPDSVRAYLADLGLRYPVGMDTTGRVADGYGVQDQPWFTLVSASGKILWSHDGWLSLPALESAVAHH